MHRTLTLFVVLALSLACQKTPAAGEAAATQDASTGTSGTPTSAPAAAQAADTAAAPAPTAQHAVPATLPDIVATVNGQTIGRVEFERALNTIQAQAGPVPPEQRDEFYRGVLDQLVVYHLLVQESKSRNVTVTDAEVDARIAEIRSQFPDEETFAKTLADQQLTVDALREDTRGDMLAMKTVDSALGNEAPVVSEKDVSDFYTRNAERFKQGEMVRASHILIPVPPQADAAARAQARSQAESVLKQAREGADFAALARTHSQDGSAANGGDLGFFPRGQMVPAFEQAAFSLQPGQISDIVETQFGYHIIKAGPRQSPRTVPLAEVSGEINQFLQQRARQEKMAAFIDGLKAKSKIEVFL